MDSNNSLLRLFERIDRNPLSSQPGKQSLDKGNVHVNSGDANSGDAAFLPTSTKERDKSTVKANKKVVLKLDLHDGKGILKAMKVVASVSGVDSLSMDKKEKKLTVIGDVDPINLVRKLRKFVHTDILTVGPAKEPEKLKDEGKKDEGKKEDEKKEQIAELVYNPHMSYYQTDDQSDSSSSSWTLHDFLTEAEKEMYKKIKRKTNTLNRIRGFLLLMLSSPMPISDKAKYENRVQDISNIYSQVRVLEAAFNSNDMNKWELYLQDTVKRDFATLSTLIAELLDDPAMDEIETYIPRHMFEKMYKPLEADDPLLEAAELGKKLEALPSTSSARVEESEMVEKETVCVPQEILRSAVLFVVNQISDYIKSKKFHNIRVCGRGESRVLQLLIKDPEEDGAFAFVNVADNQSNSEIQANIAQQLSRRGKISNNMSLPKRELYYILEKLKFLLLLDGVNKRINLYKMGIPLNPENGVIVFTTGSHEISPTMAVEVEINVEDHLLAWKLFCEIVGEFVHSSSVQHFAIRIFEECSGHLLAVVLMARYLKNVTDVNIWEDALHKLSSQPFEIQSTTRVVARALVLLWEHMDTLTKHCIKYCASHPKRTWFNKVSLISDWIKNGLIHTHHEGTYILEDLTCAFLLENIGKGESVLLQDEAHDILLSKYILEGLTCPLILMQGGLGLTESPKDREWDATEIHLMDNNLSELPDSPNCPVLLALFLQRNYDLTEIPLSFFDHMPVLQVLDLSYTSIKILPQSLFQLVALRKFLLRGCELFMDLPPQVGELKNLEELDLDKTEIMQLPRQIGNLNNLKILKVSFYGYVNCSKKNVQLNEKIPPGAISNLFQLIELSIDVNPDDEQWDVIVEVVMKEVSSLTMLKALNLYMPEAKLLDKLRSDSTSLTYPSLSHFRFIVGHHKQRIIVRVPHEVEAEFNKWDKCLKLVNGENMPNAILEVLSYATAFFLDRHMAVTKLSEFGNINVKKLKFCILAECNQMQTIVDGEEFYEEENDDTDDEYADIYEYDSYFAEESVLESLQYLNIYYMRDLVSIWKGPIRDGCLSRLKFLELHTCPQLSTIFIVSLLRNLNNLEELVIEDCPQVNSLVSRASFNLASDQYFLPKLKRMSLLYLPELVSISCGLYIAPKLERIGFYNCPKLISLSKKELSSKNLKVIKGENKWWEVLQWNQSEWGGRPEHLDLIFSPINKEEDVMTQLAKDEDLVQASKQE